MANKTRPLKNLAELIFVLKNRVFASVAPFCTSWLYNLGSLVFELIGISPVRGFPISGGWDL